MRVLLVDDDARTRQTLARVLHRAGLTVVAQAEDGQAALAAIDALARGAMRPNLIITDCDMPRMNGIALTRAVRRQGMRMPVVMLTGQEDPVMVAEALEAGVTAYLLKPLDLPRLLAAIQDALRRSRAA